MSRIKFLSGDLTGLDGLSKADLVVFGANDSRPFEGVAGYVDWRLCGRLADLRLKNSFYGKKNIVEYLSYSNILPDSIETVLTSSEVNQLTREVAKIKKKLYNNFKKNNKKISYHQYGLDLEFKIYGKERNIYLKQIRPFKN